MLTRRHIRVKVMQSLYAFNQSKNDNLASEEKFLMKSMQEMYDLFLLQLSLLLEIRYQAENYLEKSQQKFLATSEEKNPSRRFIDNKIFQILDENEDLQDLFENRKINHWKQDDEYANIIWTEIRESLVYEDYMQAAEHDFKQDRDFIIEIFKNFVAPNDKLYDYLEDKKLTWLDDLPLVNTAVVKFLQKLKESHSKHKKVPQLFKNDEDKEFAIKLFRKTYVNDEELAEEMLGKTPNWDQDRIAEIDMILIKMATCEFLYFPSIPVKVTINEYLEIAKEYSTPKSSIFINGVLDKLSKEYKADNKLNKTGRGLM